MVWLGATLGEPALAGDLCFLQLFQLSFRLFHFFYFLLLFLVILVTIYMSAVDRERELGFEGMDGQD